MVINPSLPKSSSHTLWGSVKGPPKGRAKSGRIWGSKHWSSQGMTGRLWIIKLFPPKTNISPENQWLEDDSFPFEMVPFRGTNSFISGVARLQSSHLPSGCHPPFQPPEAKIHVTRIRCLKPKQSNQFFDTWAAFKTFMTFHYTGWLMGILLMVPYNPCITG